MQHPVPQILVKPVSPGAVVWPGGRAGAQGWAEPRPWAQDPPLHPLPTALPGHSSTLSSSSAVAEIELSRQLSTNIFGELSRQHFSTDDMDKCFLQVQLCCSASACTTNHRHVCENTARNRVTNEHLGWSKRWREKRGQMLCRNILNKWAGCHRRSRAVSSEGCEITEIHHEASRDAHRSARGCKQSLRGTPAQK